MCQYGAPYRKSTALLTNEETFLKLARRCPGQHQHVQLVGPARVKLDGKCLPVRIQQAELCREWSRLAVAHFGRLGWRRRNDFCSALAAEASGAAERQAPETSNRDDQDDWKISEAHRDVLGEASRFIKERPVVFGQFTQQDIDAIKASSYDRPYKTNTKAV